MANLLRQTDQIRNSSSYDDTISSGATLESGSENIEDDLNALRSQVNKIIDEISGGGGGTNWYDTPNFSVTPSIGTGTENYIALWNSGGISLKDSLVSINSSGVILPDNNGSVTDPVYSFGGDTNTGIYWISADTLGITTNGTLRTSFNSSGLISTIPIDIAISGVTDGTKIMEFSIERGWEIQQISSGANAQLAFVPQVDGLKRISIYNQDKTDRVLSIVTDNIDTNNIVEFFNVARGGAASVASPTFSFNGDSNTGIFNSGTDALGLVTGGANRVNITNSILTSTVLFQGPDGTVGAPTYSFSGDTDTGFYLISSNQVSLALAGIEKFRFNNFGSTGKFLIYDGAATTPSSSETQPSLSFINASNTGIYRDYVAGFDQLMFSVEGNAEWEITVGGTVINNRLQVGNSTNPRYKNIDLLNPLFAHITGSPDFIYADSATTTAPTFAQADLTNDPIFRYIRVQSGEDIVISWELPLMEDTIVSGLRLRFFKNGTGTIKYGLYVQDGLATATTGRFDLHQSKTITSNSANVQLDEFNFTTPLTNVDQETPMIITLSITSSTTINILSLSAKYNEDHY